MKDAKSSSLMDLELADYQKSIEGLKAQIKEKESLTMDLEKRVSTLINQNEQLQKEKGMLAGGGWSHVVGVAE